MTACKLWGWKWGGGSRAGAVRLFLGLLLTALSILLLSQCSPRPSKQAITIVLSVNPDSGLAPLEVAFDASRSFATDGSSLTFTWELRNGDSYTGPVLIKGFEDPGDYVIKLKVTSERGATATAERTVRVLSARASPQDVLLTPANPRHEAVGGLIIALADTADTKLRMRVRYFTPDKQPPVSPFELLGVWHIVREDSFDGKGGSDHPLLSLSFPVRPGASDALVAEWAGDFWFPARNEDGAPGGSLDAQGMFVRLGRRDLSFFSLARWKREIVDLLSRLPDEFPPQPTIEGIVSPDVGGGLVLDIEFFQHSALLYNNPLPWGPRSIELGGVWNCIDVVHLSDGAVMTWDPLPIGRSSPLLGPERTQRARVLFPSAGGEVGVCVRPCCAAALGRSALDWCDKLGLPAEEIEEIVWAMQTLIEAMENVAGRASMAELRWHAFKRAFLFLAGKVAKSAVRLVYLVPVATDMAATVQRCLQSKLGFVKDPCRTVVVSFPRIATAQLSLGTIGKPYSDQLIAEGGTPPYIWRIVSGELPPGISLDSRSGRLSGIPTRGGEWPITVRVLDSHGLKGEKELTITIGEATPSPAPPVPAPVPVSLEEEYLLYLSVEESVGETVLRLDRGGQFTVVVRSGGMTLTWARGAYTAKYTDATKREGTITFEVIPGVLTVEGKLFPNAIVASLMLIYPTEVWVRRGAKMVSESSVYGNYKSEDGKSGITITRGVAGNFFLVLEWRTGRRCTYECVMSDRSIEIIAPEGGGQECDVWPVNWIVVIDDNWIYTWSLVFQEWTGVWKKVLPGG